MLPYLSEAVGPNGHVLAEDIFPDFLDRAKKTAADKNVRNATFILGNEKSVQLPGNSADTVLILDAYHHFDYPKEMLASIRSGLKNDGRLAIVEFYPHGFRDPKHIRFTDKELVGELEANGFKLLSIKPFQPDTQYVAIFEKESRR
jgi:ubiquinone/menaquinone biosynthesis C-methylase UbiE